MKLKRFCVEVTAEIKYALDLVFGLFEGKNIRLKLGDKEETDFFVGFWNNLDWYGNYEPIMEQMTKAEAEK